MSLEIAKLNEYHYARGLQDRLPMESAPVYTVHTICHGTPKIDFPLVCQTTSVPTAPSAWIRLPSKVQI